MRIQWEEFIASRHCSHVVLECVFDASLLTRNGERMARYLIRQFEESLAEGYPDRWGYFRQIAATRSELGLRYVLEARGWLPDGHHDSVLEGLLHAEDARAARAAYEVYAAPDPYGRAQTLALTVMAANLLAPGAAQPDIVAFLERLSGAASPHPWNRDRAASILDDLRYHRVMRPLRGRSGALPFVSAFRGGIGRFPGRP